MSNDKFNLATVVPGAGWQWQASWWLGLACLQLLLAADVADCPVVAAISQLAGCLPA